MRNRDTDDTDRDADDKYKDADEKETHVMKVLHCLP